MRTNIIRELHLLDAACQLEPQPLQLRVHAVQVQHQHLQDQAGFLGNSIYAGIDLLQQNYLSASSSSINEWLALLNNFGY